MSRSGLSLCTTSPLFLVWTLLLLLLPAALKSQLLPDDRLAGASVALSRQVASGIVALPAGMTGEALKALVDPLIGRLEQAASRATGNMQVVLRDGVDRLRFLQQDLDQSLGENVRRPLDRASTTVRVTASTLYGTVVRMDDLLSHQQMCLVANLDLFLSGMRAAIASATDPLPFTDAGAPWLGSYRFHGLRTANVVPPSGGPFTVTGFKLWTTADEPLVRILSPSRDRALATLTATVAHDGHSIAASLPAQLIDAHAGECLALEVTAFDKTGLLRRTRRTTRSLPLCLERRVVAGVQVSAFVSYEELVLDRRALEYKSFPEAANSSCGTNPLYSASLNWPVPAGYAITGFEFAAGYPESRHDDGRTISVSVSGRSSVTAAGNQARPRCIDPPLAPARLLSHSYWRATIRPIIEGQIPRERTDSAVAPPADLTGSEVIVCARPPKSTATDRTIAWFTFRNTDPAAPGFDFTSSQLIVPPAGFDGPIAMHEGIAIDARVNPNPVAGRCEICVRFQ